MFSILLESGAGLFAGAVNPWTEAHRFIPVSSAVESSLETMVLESLTATFACVARQVSLKRARGSSSERL